MALGQLWASIGPYREMAFGALSTSGESGGEARVVPTACRKARVSRALPLLDQWMDPKVEVTLEGTGMFSQVKPLVFEVA
jgi:hypothetical protein